MRCDKGKEETRSKRRQGQVGKRGKDETRAKTYKTRRWKKTIRRTRRKARTNNNQT